MTCAIIKTLMLRELRALRRQIEAYPDESLLWAQPDGVSNTAGNLALHLSGNLQHFVGAKLGGTGYVRDRDAEFARRDVGRAEILREIDATSAAVAQTLDRVGDDGLSAPFPEPILQKTIARPRPAPPPSLLRASSNRPKRWRMKSRCCSGTPGPSSSTSIDIVAPAEPLVPTWTRTC